MIELSIDDIIFIHSEIIKLTGGSDGIRDKKLFESSVINNQLLSGHNHYNKD